MTLATMLGDPVKLRTPRGYGYLVSWRDKLRINNQARAEDLVQRVLADPANVRSLLDGLGRPDAPLEELREWLCTGLGWAGSTSPW